MWDQKLRFQKQNCWWEFTRCRRLCFGQYRYKKIRSGTVSVLFWQMHKKQTMFLPDTADLKLIRKDFTTVIPDVLTVPVSSEKVDNK